MSILTVGGMKKVGFLSKCLILGSSLLALSATTSSNYSIDVKFSNVRNNKGAIQIQVYRDQATFKEETPWKVFYAEKQNVKDGKLNYLITDLPAGTYGIAILDDENRNKKMDYSFMMPKEGFGFSNYYLTGMFKPKFDNFKFTLTGDETVSVKVKYL